MWTFRTIGEGDEATSFEATFDGPVENAGAALGVIAEKAADLSLAARELCQETLNLAAGHVRQVANGKRRFSMNLSGGMGPQGAWTLTLQLSLAEDPAA